MKNLGIVIIGRNEGDLLQKCLHSVIDQVNYVVYVDSGSTDGSIDLAKSLGVEVVELDLSIPFTAARARNEGANYLLGINPQLEFIQFVDGDCEVVTGWLENAYEAIQEQSDLAVVCGRRRERFPEQSIYNLLCDIEWNTPVGEAEACGGDSMIRVCAFEQVQGFNSTLIAGEEPELCLRLRRQEWKIWRLDTEMTLHDAQITRFSQWWQRSLRCGHAYAEGFWLHGNSSERYCLKEIKSVWFWGLIVPLISLGFFRLSHGWIALILLGYPLIIYKNYGYLQTRGFDAKNSLLYAISCMAMKFPQVQGQIQFHLNKLRGRQRSIVEYKNSEIKVESAK